MTTIPCPPPTQQPFAAWLSLGEYIDQILARESAHAARGAALSAYSDGEIAERWARTTVREVCP